MTGSQLAALLSVAASLFWLWPLCLLARRYVHILQLEEYSNARFLSWRNGSRRLSVRIREWEAILPALALIVTALLRLYFWTELLIIFWAAAGIHLLATARPRPAKRPLVYTARVRRLLAASAIFGLALAAIIAAVALVLLHAVNRFATGVLIPALPVIALLILDARAIVAGNLLAQPVEAWLRRRYRRQAHARVRGLHPKIIAITGSYGKTTTKELVASVLSTRFATVKTPESWNTLMGVTRAIRERLKAEHEIFVVEMGAYKRGEIAELCGLTGAPDIGILTGINEQHLERFGGIENTIKAKYELIEAVRPGGVAIFNVDNPYCQQLAEKTGHARVVRVGLREAAGRLDYSATDVSVSAEGTRFTCIAGSERVAFRTRLLGEHFVLNVLAATAAARECGMTLQQISAAVAAMPPVAHRLQLLQSAGGIATIDDAYSANPDGARAALHVLEQMNGGRRILVTPGFVELGDRETEFNHDLGRLARSACDILVLVGERRTAPIRDGALSAGMDPSSIRVVQSIGAARELLEGVARAGDTILFENDLPDNYDE